MDCTRKCQKGMMRIVSNLGVVLWSFPFFPPEGCMFFFCVHILFIFICPVAGFFSVSGADPFLCWAHESPSSLKNLCKLGI